VLSLFFLPSASDTASRWIWRSAVWLVLLLALALYGAFGRQLFLLSTLGTVFLYIVLTQAWNILGGYGGYLNFGMVTFFGVGAYASAVLFQYWELSPFLTAPIAGVASAILGVLIGIPTLRIRGAYFALVTMIITFAAQILVLDLPFTQGALGIYLQPLRLTPVGVERLFYLLFLSCAVMATILVYAIEHSNFGWALVAIREDEDAAAAMGINTALYKTAAFALSGAFAGLTGGVFAYWITFIDPEGVFRVIVTIQMIIMAVFGGMGTVVGPLLGALVLATVSEVLSTQLVSLAELFNGVIVILVVLFMPKGLADVIRKREFSLRKLARNIREYRV